MFRKLSLALLAASALSTTPANAANLLTNASFEDGFNGWTLGGSSGDGYPPVVIAYNQGSGYPDGAFGESIPTDNAAGNPDFDAVGTHGVYFVADLAHPQTLTQQVNITNGTQYIFGFDVYVPFNGQNNGNDANFSATVGGFTFANFAASATPAGNWLHLSSTGFGNGNGLVDFVFEYSSFGVPAKDFIIDRVYFAETGAVPEPATWAMMLAGFGVVGFAMRRRRDVRVNFA
jgi:PEP-CTERM motif